jgi:predicted Zn finger-like uncharacterized protein
MSFRITQCPACESTFSTSPRVLESAAGKVRCGACLTVFEAAENFLATGFDGEAENESVFVGNSAQEFFDPASFFTRQSLRESVPDAALESAPQISALPVTEAIPEPRLDPDDPDTPAYLALDSAELAAEAAGDAGQAVQVAPEEDEFLALVADAQMPPPDLSPPQPVAELLAAGGYPAMAEVIEELLAEDYQATASQAAQPPLAELLAAGGYPALEEVIAELLAEPAETKETKEPASHASDSNISVPGVPLQDTSGDSLDDEQETAQDIAAHINAAPAETDADTQSQADTADAVRADEPGSLPLFPDEPEAPHSNTDTSQAEPPAAPPEAFQLHAQFSLSPGGYAPPAEAPAAPEPPPASSTDLAEEIEGEFNAAVNEADFQQTLANDMDSVASEQPDVELSRYSAPDETLEGTDADHSAAPEANTGQSSAEPDQSVAAIRARALQSDLQDEDGLEAIPQENLQSLGAFSTPVEILTGRQRRLGKQLAWASLALVAAIMLAGQYLWQELERYAQVASVRPVYEWACNLTGCELPVYNDIDAIQSSNLSVRSHPAVDNALSVSVEFRNAASFAQRFPIMVLSFNSASNSVIALREFAPDDYLPPALRSRTLLPPQTPVQVSLELMDPGEDAINYTLAFRRP